MPLNQSASIKTIKRALQLSVVIIISSILVSLVIIDRLLTQQQSFNKNIQLFENLIDTNLKIAKNIYLLEELPNFKESQTSLTSIKKDAKQWNDLQQSLHGALHTSAKLNLKSPELDRLIFDIATSQNSLFAIYDGLNQDILSELKILNIEQTANTYASSMKQLMKMYQTKAEVKLNDLKIVVYILASIVISIILIGYMFFLRPTFLSLKNLKKHNENQRQQYSSILSNINDLIWSVDRNYRLFAFNDVFAELMQQVLNLKPKVGDNLLSNTSINLELKHTKELYDRAFSGESFSVEYQVVKAEETQYKELSFHPILDDNKEVFCVSVYRKDITERSKIYEQLANNEKSLAEAQVIANIGSFQWNLITNEIQWSDHLYSVYGFDKDSFEPTYDNIVERFHPDDREQILEKFYSSIENHEPINAVNRIVLTDGSIRYINHIGKGLYNEKNEPYLFLGTTQDITELELANLKIAKNEKILEEAQTLANIGSWQWDLITNTITFSNNLYRVYGIEKHNYELSFDNIVALVHPEDREMLIAKTQESIEQQTPLNTINKIIQPNGVVRYVKHNGKAKYNAKDEPVAFEGTTQDITELELARIEVAKKEQSLEEAQVIANLGSWEWNIITDEIIWSDNLYKVYGVDKTDFAPTMKNISALVHPEDREQVMGRYQHSLEKKENINTVNRIILNDGSIRYTRHTGIALYDKDGEPYLFRGTTQDVTELELANLKIAKNEQTLKEAQVIANIGSWQWDLSNGNNTFSDNLYKVYGVDKNSFEPTFENVVGLVHPEDRENLMGKIQDSIDNRTPMKATSRIVWPDGTIRYVKHNGKVNYNKNHEPISLYGTTQDITDLELANIKIANQFKELQNFVYIISHNIRVPIANLLGLTEIFNTGDHQLNEKIIENVKHAVKRLDGTISDLNQSLKIKNVNQNEFEEVKLQDIAEEVEDLITYEITKNDAKIDWDFSKAPIAIGMKSYFINILFNLVLNAVIYKHPERDITVSVHSRPTKANGIKIIVADNGMGIDLNEEKRERMFSMYGRLQHNTEGSGLGLYLVKTQVEALGGRIEVESTLGKGTTFTIRLNKNMRAPA